MKNYQRLGMFILPMFVAAFVQAGPVTVSGSVHKDGESVAGAIVRIHVNITPPPDIFGNTGDSEVKTLSGVTDAMGRVTFEAFEVKKGSKVGAVGSAKKDSDTFYGERESFTMGGSADINVPMLPKVGFPYVDPAPTPIPKEFRP